MKIVLTGTNGNLGRALVKYLQNAHELLCCCHGAVPVETENIRYISMASRDFQAQVADFDGDCLIHAAASYGGHGETIDRLVSANVSISVKMFEIAKANNYKRVLYCNTALQEQVSDYALSKHQAAQWGERILGDRFINVLLQIFYGEMCDDSNLITNMIKKALRSQTIDLTVGTQKRDLIHLNDICSAVELILRTEKLKQRDIPLGTGHSVPFREIMEYINVLCGQKGQLNFGKIPLRVHEPVECVADIRFLSNLGWRAQYDYKTGIKQVADKIISEEGKRR